MGCRMKEKCQVEGTEGLSSSGDGRVGKKETHGRIHRTWWLIGCGDPERRCNQRRLQAWESERTTFILAE